MTWTGAPQSAGVTSRTGPGLSGPTAYVSPHWLSATRTGHRTLFLYAKTKGELLLVRNSLYAEALKRGRVDA
ncbi:hypothetical protein [Streptomyces sp. DG1A-41]|uniref:hypothetical protein n=1 Tax=Streptomyces sp. DG1A-41 TaxID=3125779 RepID=UPI0030D44A08